MKNSDTLQTPILNANQDIAYFVHSVFIVESLCREFWLFPYLVNCDDGTNAT